jgi:transposase
MANRLSMAKVNAILSLHRSGHSNRRIAKLLGVDRETVGKYVEAAENQPSAPIGSAKSPESLVKLGADEKAVAANNGNGTPAA